MSRQIVGIIYKFDGLTPWTGARLVFSLLTDTATGADAAWPVWSKTVTAGDGGAIPDETKLDTPPSGSWKYRLKIEENTPLDFYLEQGDGSDLSISDIVTLAGVAGNEAGTPQGEFLNGLYALVAGAADGRLLETAGGGLALTDAPGGYFMQRTAVPDGESVTIPAGCQMIVYGDFTAIGDLIAIGDLVIL